MLWVFLIASYAVCGIGEDLSEIYGDFYYKEKPVNFIKVSSASELGSCDVVVADVENINNEEYVDEWLLAYLKNGGNLLLVFRNSIRFSRILKNIPFVVAGTLKVSDTFTIEGHGIFANINHKIVAPSLYFIPDTEKIRNYMCVSDSGWLSGQIVLYATQLGHGSLVVTSVSLNELGKEVFSRIMGYFFPDIVIFARSFDSLYLRLVEDGTKEGLFIKLYDESFEGDVNAKMVVTEKSTNLIAGDSTKIIYTGGFVCEKLVKCDTTLPYNIVISQNMFFKLTRLRKLKLSNGESKEIIFTNLYGDTVGFISKRDDIGVFPFELSSFEYNYILFFLKALLTKERANMSKNVRLAYFTGPASGLMKNVVSMEIYSVDGRLVMHFKGDEVLCYNLDALPDGMYIIKLRLIKGKDSVLLYNKFQGESQ